MKNEFGVDVKEWGPVDRIGIPVTRVGGFGVRTNPLGEFMKGSTDMRSEAQQKADRELFLHDPKAYIDKVRNG